MIKAAEPARVPPRCALFDYLLAFTEASPEALALAFALACTGELIVLGCGAVCDGCPVDAGFAKSALGASSAPVRDPDALPFALPLT